MLSRVALRACCTAAVLSCGGPSDPETALRSTLEAAEAAIEARDLGDVKDAISEAYSDDAGNDKRELTRYLAALLLRNSAVHVATRVRELRVEDGSTGHVVMIAALASGPIETPADLTRLRADLYRFEFRFTRADGDWKLLHARWRPATAVDLFP